VSGDRHDGRGRPDLDRDGVPLPTEPPGELAEVYPLHPPTGGRDLDPSGQAGRGGLVVEDLGAVLDRVDDAGPPGWLIEGLWPSDAYGVLAAEDKAGKTWAILDLAVSVAAGRPWLGAYPCPQAGRVLVFLGQGNQRAIVRRLRAICAHKHLQVQELAARIRLCFRVPRLTSGADLTAVAGELAAAPAALVIVDPLYLAVGVAGAGADLYAMGAVLARYSGGVSAGGGGAGGGDPLEQDRRGPRPQTHYRGRPGRLGPGLVLGRGRPPHHQPRRHLHRGAGLRGDRRGASRHRLPRPPTGMGHQPRRPRESAALRRRGLGR
jgi:AAA domain